VTLKSAVVYYDIHVEFEVKVKVAVLRVVTCYLRVTVLRVTCYVLRVSVRC
jgi:hypothetical protein